MYVQFCKGVRFYIYMPKTRRPVGKMTQSGKFTPLH